MNAHITPAQQLRRKALHWAVKLRVNPRVVRVCDMKRKWGSCSSKGTISLAWELTQRDARFQDYVVVHELLHLRVSNHGRLFKALMSAHVPEWRRWSQMRAAAWKGRSRKKIGHPWRPIYPELDGC